VELLVRVISPMVEEEYIAPIEVDGPCFDSYLAMLSNFQTVHLYVC